MPALLAKPTPTLPRPDEIAAEQARRHLGAFVRQAWHVVEPATDFVPGWHLDCIAEHLEAVTAGQIRNLVINVPPRHMKSLAVSVFWPCWEWLTTPARRWVFASYAEALSIRDSVKSRRLIQSNWYQQHWGNVFQLIDDQNTKTKFENDATGHRMATSVGGVGTGEGGDRLVVDDPHNVLEAESEAVRSSVLTWWDEVMSTRGNDPKTVARVIVMQRTHETDLSGHVLDKGTYHHLCLPARYERRVQVDMAAGKPAHVEPQPHDDCTIATDPRHVEGDLLWPARFGEPELAALTVDLAAYGTAGQLQQRPVPRAGALFRSDWFRPLPLEFHTIRPKLTVVMHWDLAWSEKQSADYTAAASVGIDQAGNLYLLHMWRGRVDESRLPAALAEVIIAVRPAYVTVEEGAFQQAATQDLIRLVNLALMGRFAVSVESVKVTTDKVARAQLPAGRAKLGMVYADKTAPWWPAFEAEALKFPRASHDDQVDAFSGGSQAAIEHGSLAKVLDAIGRPMEVTVALGGQPETKTDVFRQWFAP